MNSIGKIFSLNHYFLFSQLQRTSCSFSELNYTLIIENKQGNIQAEVDTFPDLDSGVIGENIKLNLNENQEYSMKLQVKAQSQTAISQKHIFSKLHYSILTTETLY